MSYSKFYKYVLKRNKDNPDIKKNFDYNQSIKSIYGTQICLQNDLDAIHLVLAETECLTFIEKNGSKYTSIIQEYNETIEHILDDIEIRTEYVMKNGKIELKFPKVYMQSLARSLSDHRLNLSKLPTGLLYKTHLAIYQNTFEMFQYMFKEATKKTKLSEFVAITEEQAKQFGYTYTLQRTYAGIKATIVNVNKSNTILFIPTQIGQFPVTNVMKKEVGEKKHNHLIFSE